jgi:hypothetical protein
MTPEAPSDELKKPMVVLIRNIKAHAVPKMFFLEILRGLLLPGDGPFFFTVTRRWSWG